MGKKKITERYKQLRILIMRAKEDADKWGTEAPPRILQGIKETSAHDYTVYDEAYLKFVAKRVQKMSEAKIGKAVEEETAKLDESSEIKFSGEELQLSRIADALERLADASERNQC